MTFEEHKSLLYEVLQNDEAVDFIFRLGKVFRVWDNVWDQDKPYTKEDVDDCFAELAFGLLNNSFYAKHRGVLDAQIFVAWNAWKDANEWAEDENPAKRRCAYFIRDYCNEIVVLSIYLLYGTKKAREFSLKIREEYLKELED